EIWHTMGRNLDVMEAAVNKGAAGDGVYSTTGLTGGEAVLLKKYRQKGHTLSGDTMMQAVQNAISTNEVNASMG
ncbi:L-serine ammonia-lyase, iron-sulfur-dependent, subunit alpha, partial [Streptococcus thermophilus]|nr:L-serine ammonia-lyase, iron-sulfur-dependent, subunit alpha [Streptococcus thermophilus]